VRRLSVLRSCSSWVQPEASRVSVREMSLSLVSAVRHRNRIMTLTKMARESVSVRWCGCYTARHSTVPHDLSAVSVDTGPATAPDHQ
jgi:hypothetical protein